MADRPPWQTVPENHPALPGHFPGRPVVPGVVLLSYVRDALCSRASGNIRCTAWPSVKFLAPLHPGEAFAVEVDFNSAEAAKFSVRTAERLIAQGSVHFTAEQPA